MPNRRQREAARIRYNMKYKKSRPHWPRHVPRVEEEEE